MCCVPRHYCVDPKKKKISSFSWYTGNSSKPKHFFGATTPSGETEFNFYLLHSGLGTLGMVGGGLDTSMSFAQEWIFFTDCLLFRNTKIFSYYYLV